MIDVDGQTLAALTFLSGCISDWRVKVQLIQARTVHPLEISLDTRARFLNAFEVLESSAQRLEMAGVARAARRGFDASLNLLTAPIGYDAHRLSQVIAFAEQAVLPFMDEMQSRRLFTMSPRHAAFFSIEFPFGASVDASFPSASYDIVEAAKCRALSRWTACVMHMMRALEVGLRALAQHYDVDSGQNWNVILNHIEAKSREVGKRTHGAEEEKWASEAAVHLRFIKNAWRNHAMHPLEKYDEDRAVAVFDNTGSFLKHLALKLAEQCVR